MYKIHMLRVGEKRYMKINFLFSKSVTGNQLILMYYFVQGRVAAAERVATAVLIGEAIYYTWRLWQLLKEKAEGYQAGEATVKNIREYKLFPGSAKSAQLKREKSWIHLQNWRPNSLTLLMMSLFKASCSFD